MNKVTTINLNGRAYQLEERGFDALRKYLDAAAAKLHGNPDKDEIMADFEQAIADKFDQKLSSSKNVILEKEVGEIIAAMGPVDVADSENAKAGAQDTASQKKETGGGAMPRRLFRIPEGEWIMGVCTGLAAYFNLDVTLVRVVFIVLGVFTHGFWIAAYIILAIVMPAAKTEEEFSQAHGWSPAAPFNANDFIEQAKTRYAEFRDNLQKKHDEHIAKHASGEPVDAHKVKEDTNKWKHEFRKEMHEKRQQMKQEWRQQQHEWYQARQADRFRNQDRNPGWMVSQVFLGIFSVIVSLAIAALAVGWILAIISLIKHGTILGYAFGAGHPLWISIVFLVALFYIVVIPLASLLHGVWGMSYYRDVRRSGWESFGRALIFLGVLVILFLTARELYPEVGMWWNGAVEYLKIHL